MSDEILDDFRDVSGWSAVASGQAQLGLGRDTGPDGSALRLDYDFRGGGGFVVARKLFARRMPESWAIELQIRGAAPANRLEIKLADPTGRNVWWWHRDAFEFPHTWEPLRIRSSRGVVRVGACRWRRAPRARRDRDRDRRRARRRRLGIGGALASRGSFAHRTTARARVERDTRSRGGARGRRVARNELAQCVGRDAVDRARLRPRVRVRRHRGRLGARPEARAFDVQSSADGARWTTLWSARQAEGERSYVYLPGGGHSRHLRLHLLEAAEGRRRSGSACSTSVRSTSRAHSPISSTPSRRASRADIHPRWLHREQSYWTRCGHRGRRRPPRS